LREIKTEENRVALTVNLLDGAVAQNTKKRLNMSAYKLVSDHDHRSSETPNTSTKQFPDEVSQTCPKKSFSGDFFARLKVGSECVADG
jgi:hypothetical protein